MWWILIGTYIAGYLVQLRSLLISAHISEKLSKVKHSRECRLGGEDLNCERCNDNFGSVAKAIFLPLIWPLAFLLMAVSFALFPRGIEHAAAARKRRRTRLPRKEKQKLLDESRALLAKEIVARLANEYNLPNPTGDKWPVF
jgi:hypothetical protein